MPSLALGLMLPPVSAGRLHQTTHVNIIERLIGWRSVFGAPASINKPAASKGNAFASGCQGAVSPLPLEVLILGYVLWHKARCTRPIRISMRRFRRMAMVL
jgi:hypothetical protein